MLSTFYTMEELTEFRASAVIGWFFLAEAFQNQGQTEKAQQAYYKCIEFPTSPLAYRALYQLSLRDAP